MALVLLLVFLKNVSESKSTSFSSKKSKAKSSSSDYENILRYGINAECAVKVSNGAIASMAELDYHVIKSEGFEKCPKLVEAASVLATLTFDFDTLGIDEMIRNLKTLSKVF